MKKKLVNFQVDLADDAEGTGTLTVEAHVLGVRLGEADAVAVFQELTHCEGVAVDIA